MNMNEKPFDNPKVRQAVNYAINKQALCKVAYSGYARPADGVIPEQIPNAVKLGPWPYDPKKARELLKEAGYPNGFTTEIWSGYSNSTSAKVVQFLQQPPHGFCAQAHLLREFIHRFIFVLRYQA